jgi:hypothetical protein
MKTEEKKSKSSDLDINRTAQTTAPAEIIGKPSKIARFAKKTNK